MSTPTISLASPQLAYRSGSAVSISLEASPTPDSWTAAPLPAGLSLAGSTISGTVSSTGRTVVTLTATHDGDVSAPAHLVIVVDDARPPKKLGTVTYKEKVGIQFGLNKGARLKAKAEAEEEAERRDQREGDESLRLQPNFPWRATPFRPTWFE